MKLSTKGRYGLRAMVDLVVHSEEEPVSIASIAARQHISESYLEQLIAKLKKAGLVTSVRGALGGYIPSRKAESISVGDDHAVIGIRSNRSQRICGCAKCIVRIYWMF